jgi:1-acyl-sn-glycerol-3-phosphate acyltransferase
MSISQGSYRGPIRRATRSFLRLIIRCAFCFLTRLEIVGAENIPRSGPLLLAVNHFHFADPVALIRAFPNPLEFVGGAQMPFAPRIVRFLPKLWGYHAVHRGTGARDALRKAEDVLNTDGVVGIFPEGGSWASVLRPARPGTAFLAVRTGARILPVGIDGLVDLFPALFRGRRAQVRVCFGETFGPFEATGRGRERRVQLDEIGETIMKRISLLIPQEQRGCYSTDARVRAEAKGTEIYPWARRRTDEQER